MDSYDNLKCFVRRITERVSEFLAGTTTWRKILGISQKGHDEHLSTSKNDDQPVNKSCSSDNDRTCVDIEISTSLTEDQRNSLANIVLPEMSAVNCVPNTSKPSPTRVRHKLYHIMYNRNIPC